MSVRDKPTQKICWAATWGGLCEDYRGQPLSPVWRLKSEETGQEALVCDAHLAEGLRRMGLPARVEKPLSPPPIRPPSYSVRGLPEECTTEKRSICAD